MIESNNNHHHAEEEQARSLRWIDEMVRRQLNTVGKLYWGTTLVLWSKFKVKGHLYNNGGYWWVAGQNEDGRGYQWDILYQGEAGCFLVGHARGNIRTETVSEEELEAVLLRALDFGPIEQIPGSGYVG